MTTAQRMMQARTALLLEQPFFGALALHLKLIESENVPTAGTNGTVLVYNPKWIETLTNPQLKGLLAHEVMHCAAGHPWRRDAREPRKFNLAADFAINPLLIDAGLTLPDNGCIDPQYKGLSAEAVYGMLPIDPPGDNNRGNDPGGNGGVDDAPKEGDGEGVAEDPAVSEEEWKQAVLVAAKQAEQRGQLPAGMERLLGAIRKPACRDLVSALREFVGRSAREDYSWRRPNVRYVAHGLYLPTLHSVTMPPVACAIDTSGSIDDELLTSYVGAMQVVLDECRPESLTVTSCDAKVHSVCEYEPGDAIATAANSYKGGGGTDFRAVFTDIASRADEPCCLVYLTDGDGYAPETAPAYPVLWAIKDSRYARKEMPWGEVIYLD